MFRLYLVFLLDRVTNHRFGVLRVKIEDHGKPHCHKQELVLVAHSVH